MVQIIAGNKGKGKTRCLLEMANNKIKEAEGSVVYLDKSTKHMYELNNKVRLINVNEFPILDSHGFIGFISGILSSDHDIEEMYLDNFLKLSCLEDEDETETLLLIDKLGKKYSVNFVLGISKDADELPEQFQKDVIVAL